MKELKDYNDSELIEEFQKRGYLRVLWTKEDIIQKGLQMDLYLKDEAVDNIASDIENNWDASIGLSWDVIEYFIEKEIIYDK